MSEVDEHWIKGDIGISDGIIKFVGKAPEQFSADSVIDGSDYIIIPGLVNAHNHLSMTLLRNYADDLELFSWLHDKIWPIERHMQPHHIYWGSMIGAAEQIRGGITAFADMYFHQEETIKAIIKAGMRGNIGATFMGNKQDTTKRLPGTYNLYNTYHGAGDGRISIDIAPHAIYTCTRETLEITTSLARELNTRLHIHVSETIQEVEDCKKEHDTSPVEYLASIGLFAVPTYAAHCVHLSEQDMEILKEYQVKPVHNPTSNLKLGSGFAPVQKFLDYDMSPALGTDGASSNNNLNMFEEIHLAAIIHKGYSGDPTAVTAYQALQMATINGAKALGIDHKTGSIEPGKEADLVFINIDTPHMQPMHNPVSAVAYSAQASDVDTVICRGNILMKHRELLTIDEEEVIRKTSETARTLIY